MSLKTMACSQSMAFVTGLAICYVEYACLGFLCTTRLVRHLVAPSQAPILVHAGVVPVNNF